MPEYSQACAELRNHLVMLFQHRLFLLLLKGEEHGRAGKKRSRTEAEQRQQERLLRLKQVLELIPVSKSTWWDGVKNGKFPNSIKLGARTTCWRESEILLLMQREV